MTFRTRRSRRFAIDRFPSELTPIARHICFLQGDQNIANQAGAAFRSDLNSELQALVTLSSGATAPATTYARQLWADTTTNTLKRRNAANSAWLVIRSLDETFMLSRSSNTILGLSDIGKTIVATSNFTQTLTAAATLGDGWWIGYRVESGVTITLDPNASEQIDGATTKVLVGPTSGFIYCDGSAFKTIGYPTAGTATAVPVRQTVLNGAVDSNGLPSFGGSTGSTTVTQTGGALTLAAANGFGSSGAVDQVFQITNPSWTGLSTNGTMYLYVDYNGGSPSTGSTTLAPTYQWGGTYSTTANQHTFNIQEMTMKVGNGSTASQTYRVFVGEVTVAGGVVTAITWYALMGRYTSAWTATLPGNGAVVSFNHNIGTNFIEGIDFLAECTTNDAGFVVGEQTILRITYPATNAANLQPRIGRNTFSFAVASTSTTFYVTNPTTGTGSVLTAGSWKYAGICRRRF
jgi:hypothetical protein